MNKKNFGPLYAKASNGKIKQWEANVEKKEDAVYLNVISGYTDGKKVTSSKKIESKNIGKSNETSPFDQAVRDAESKMAKKKDEGYFSTIKEVNITEIELPMLAQKFQDRKHYIKWPCSVQPKLNGVRCLTRYEIEEEPVVKYISRKGKFFETLNFLTSKMEKFLSEERPVADGEVFHPEWTFQEIVRALKKERDCSSKLEYWIYDIVDTKEPFEIRSQRIAEFFAEHQNGTNKFGFEMVGNLVRVPTFQVPNEEDMMVKHKLFTSEWPFEGTMVRNNKGLYLLKHRSNDLQKYKDFLDDDFEILGGTEATGNDAGTVVFQCKNKNGKIFSVRPKGSRELRAKWLKDIDNLRGELLTVRYQNLSDDGIPIFPVGIRIRDYE